LGCSRSLLGVTSFCLRTYISFLLDSFDQMWLAEALKTAAAVDSSACAPSHFEMLWPCRRPQMMI
jgi:hypothetical protein